MREDAKHHDDEISFGGDVILNVNGVPVTESDGSYDAILSSIGALKPGDALVVRVFRDGQFLKLSIPIQ
jgi:S1-C subfamily serine protease